MIIAIPQGNFQEGFSINPNAQNIVCLKEEWLGTEAASSNGRQLFEKLKIKKRCASDFQISDNKNLFSVVGIN